MNCSGRPRRLNVGQPLRLRQHIGLRDDGMIDVSAVLAGVEAWQYAHSVASVDAFDIIFSCS
ncbi:MAG: hypothetical protein KA735_01020 [Burkholderiaceae bacterium]|nr:hypothetical protein [Burkholderiaceae bacterium]